MRELGHGVGSGILIPTVLSRVLITTILPWQGPAMPLARPAGTALVYLGIHKRRRSGSLNVYTKSIEQVFWGIDAAFWDARFALSCKLARW